MYYSGLGLLVIFDLKFMQPKSTMKRSRRRELVKDCIICSMRMNPAICQISLGILKHKYCLSWQRTTDSNRLTQLLTSQGNPLNRINYRESQYLSAEAEQLRQYFNFQKTVANIKSIILERANKTSIAPMHFHGGTHDIMMRHQVSHRILSQGRFKCRIEKAGSRVSTDQDMKPIKNKEEVKRGQNGQLYTETASMRRLTRNLSTMVRKFQDNLEFHPSLIFQLMDYVPGHGMDITTLQMQELFKKELEDNFSIIQSRKENLRTNAQLMTERIENQYGFRTKDKLMNEMHDLKKKNSKLTFKNKENIPTRVQTDYDCEAIRNKKAKNSQSNGKKSLEKTNKLVVGSFSKNTKKKELLRQGSSIIKSRAILRGG